jgi:ribulose-phosphate 3-epimerase
MTVNPGFGGQNMIDSCLGKVMQLKEIKKEEGYDFLIEIDGGVNKSTYKKALKAGAEVIVTGSAFFDSENPSEYIKMLKTI